MKSTAIAIAKFILFFCGFLFLIMLTEWFIFEKLFPGGEEGFLWTAAIVLITLIYVMVFSAKSEDNKDDDNAYLRHKGMVAIESGRNGNNFNVFTNFPINPEFNDVLKLTDGLTYFYKDKDSRYEYGISISHAFDFEEVLTAFMDKVHELHFPAQEDPFFKPEIQQEWLHCYRVNYVVNGDCATSEDKPIQTYEYLDFDTPNPKVEDLYEKFKGHLDAKYGEGKWKLEYYIGIEADATATTPYEHPVATTAPKSDEEE